MLWKQAIVRERDEELIYLLMIKYVVLVEFYFSAKLLKPTFKRESKECTVDSFSTGLVGEGIFRAGLKQKSPVVRE